MKKDKIKAYEKKRGYFNLKFNDLKEETKDKLLKEFKINPNDITDKTIITSFDYLEF